MTRSFWIFCISLIFIYGVTHSQVERFGVPFSWSSSTDFTSLAPTEELPWADIPALTAEDNDDQLLKEKPFRFAISHDLNFDVASDGQWFTQSNGDRVWFQILECEDCFGIGVNFSSFWMPEGAKLFVFNGEHTDLVGALTSADNNDHSNFVTRPIEGKKIIVEYYEPYSVRQEGELIIGSATQVYKNIFPSLMEETIEDQCFLDIACPEARDYAQLASSVVTIYTDNATKACNGILVNQASNSKKPYVITSSEALVGDASELLFIFNYRTAGCDNSTIENNVKYVSGASVIATDENTGLALLKLSEAPGLNWDVYYSGWDRTEYSLRGAFSIGHPEALPQKFSKFYPDVYGSTINDLPVWQITGWNLGMTGQGFVGAPIFNSNGQLSGLFTSGTSSCSDNGPDYFVRFGSAWDSFKDYLDPTQENLSNISGSKPPSRPLDPTIIDQDLAIFPNPAINEITIYNGNVEDIALVKFYDANGALVKQEIPRDQVIKIEDLNQGVYIVEIILPTVQLRQRLIKIR